MLLLWSTAIRLWDERASWPLYAGLHRGANRETVRDASTPLRLTPALARALRRGRQHDRKTTRKRSDLIGAVAGSDALVWIGVSPGRARLDSRNICLSRTNCFFVGRTGFIQLVAEFVLGFLELAHGLSHSTRQFRQFLCPEQDQNN